MAKEIKVLYNEKYKALQKEIKGDINKWNSLSINGRMNKLILLYSKNGKLYSDEVEQITATHNNMNNAHT